MIFRQWIKSDYWGCWQYHLEGGQYFSMRMSLPFTRTATIEEYKATGQEVITVVPTSVSMSYNFIMNGVDYMNISDHLDCWEYSFDTREAGEAFVASIVAEFDANMAKEYARFEENKHA